ncbi:MAG: NUDIX domain-containing protein [Chloroflexi bacterium]|nr:NUDIX domain-containing protein [Chloroflexota bacterium]
MTTEKHATQNIKPHQTRHAVVPRTLIFLSYRSQVLLLKGGANKGWWAGKYNGLGGHVETGEDFISAAYREVAEEAGVKSKQLFLCGIIHICGPNLEPGVALFVFRGEAESQECLPNDEGSLQWIPWHEALELTLVEDLRILWPYLQTWQPGDAPWFALYEFDADGQLEVTFSEPQISRRG